MYRKFYEDGGSTMQPDSSGQGIMQAAPQDMQQGMQQPQAPAQGQVDPSQIKDPHHALQIIIQMLVAQGIPPEQAKQIAMEMIKAVAQGGMGEMSDDRIHARFGGMMHSDGREHYGIGSFFKSVGKAVTGTVKGVVNAVKSVASSDLGKMALTAAAVYFGGPMLAGALEGTSAGTALFGTAGFGAEAATSGILGSGGAFGPLSGSILGPATQAFNQSSLGTLMGGIGTGGAGSSLLSNPLVAGGLGYLSGKMGSPQQPQQNPGESYADYQKRVDQWKSTLGNEINNPTLSSTLNPSSLYPNNPFYTQRRAEGGRIGYEDGGISGIIGQATKEGFFGQPMMANGGRMNYGLGSFISGSGVANAMSSGEASSGGSTSGFGGMLGRLIEAHPEMFKRQKDISSLTPEELQALLDQQRANVAQGGVPTGTSRQNPHGVSEIDFRKQGGYVPPIGVKEKADDIPAMLSNNEFVFTADAVRNAGQGDVNKGAKRMYRLMKHLEAGGVA
jgi:hypothetical protein